MEDYEFEPATRMERKAKVGLAGPSGSGKTMTSLKLADGLVGDEGRVALVDTEAGSSRLYADLFDFDVLELREPGPDDYARAVRTAVDDGYDAVVLDSISQEWAGANGCLAQADRFQDWSEVRPQHRRFYRTLLRAPVHVVATVRTKSKYDLEEDASGNLRVRELGAGPIQSGRQSGSSAKYEFDVWGVLDLDHRLEITGTRCPALDREVVVEPGRELGRRIARWLWEGESNPGQRRPEEDTLEDIASALDELESVDGDDDLAENIEKARRQLDDLATERSARRLLENVEEALTSLRQASPQSEERQLEAVS